MADRQSPALFARIFEILAKYDSPDARKTALEVWEEAKDYDFCHEDMDCEASLEKLGLARLKVDPSHPNDGAVWHYGPDGKDSP